MKSGVYKPAFTTIAPYYDTLMSFVNYPGWVTYIENILSLYNIQEKKIFDLACGTGTCLELWAKRGYDIFGLDRSMDMLRVCKERFTRRQDSAVKLVKGDMRRLGFSSLIPIITCLYDSLNHLLTMDDLSSCLQNVYDILMKGGIFIFDMNTIHCLRDEWGDSTFYRRDGNIDSVWSNTFDPATYTSTLKLTLKIEENGTRRTINEFHQERGYRLSLIRDMLARVGFTSTLYRHLTFDPAQESDLRIMGVAKK
jgi:ubiquinone/menaquinone biosynthesis C-methylase UbiE